jgi:lipopolysaccharide transport system ATP-binding protein
MGKMDDVSRSGRTVLFVSHNMAAVRQLTSRCILMSKGKVAFDGEPGRAIELYSDAMAQAFTQGSDLSSWPRRLPEQDRHAEFKSLSFERPSPIFNPNESVTFHSTIHARENVRDLRISGTVFHAEGYPVGSFFTDSSICIATGNECTYSTTLNNINLSPGTYSFGLSVGTGNETSGHRDFDIILEVLPFEVSALEGADGTIAAWSPNWGAIRFQNIEISKK